MPRPVQKEPTLTIKWVNRPAHLRPRGLLSYSIDSRYLTAYDEFEIEVYDSDSARLKWLQLEPVELAIYGETVLVGRIFRVERGRSGSSVMLRGLDYFSELVQGEIDPTVKISEDQTFDDVIRFCARPYGITATTDLTTKGAQSLKPGERKPEPGQGVYDFLNRIAARLGCTLQPGLTRNTVNLHEPDYGQSATASLFRSTDAVVSASNNVMDASSSEDYVRVPSFAIGSGKVAKVGDSPSTNSHPVSDTLAGMSSSAANLAAELRKRMIVERLKPDGTAPDPNKLYRLLYVKDDDARTADQIERAVTRAVGERLKDTLEYVAIMNDHREHKTGTIWPASDIINNVTDDPCDIEEPLWLSGRRFDYARNRGATTQLTHWRVGALQL